MITVPLSIATIVLLFLSAAAGSPCPEPQSTAHLLQAMKAAGQKLPPVSESCFCNLLEQKNDDDVTTLVSAFSRNFPVHDTLLFFAFRRPVLGNNPKLFSALLRLWKKTNPSLASALAALQQSGASDRMDTLFLIFDRENELEVQQLLEWIEVKKVLDDFVPVPDLICRIISRQPHLRSLALHQFETVLDELPAPLADSLLLQFEHCTPATPQEQSARLRLWIIEQYGRKQLYNQQLYAVSRLEKNSIEQCNLLLAIARDGYDRHHYAPAATAGRTLYTLACDNQLRSEAASLLAAVYREQGSADSAAAWLELSGVTTEKNRQEAVALYLTLGNLPKAAEQLKLLPPSVERDTLQLQHLLLADSLHAAQRFAFATHTDLARTGHPRLEWQFRTSLFCGSTDTCIRLLDSLTAAAPASETTRIQEYRYWLLRLAESPPALAKFIQIEYTLYKGDRELAARQLCESGRDPVNDWRIGVRIAQRQLDRSEYTAAIATLRCIPAEGEPEYLYCMADALFRNREFNGARELLRRLVLDFPADQYTTRARLLLSRIP